MTLPVQLRRLGYRIAYRLLQAQWLITRPRLQGVKCLLTDEHLVLLVRHTYGARHWDLPGGRLRRHEAPAACARREIREELGLNLVDCDEVGTIAVSTRARRDTLHVFRAELAAPALRLDLGELSEARWFARAALPADLAPYVIPALARTTVRRPGR